MTRVLSRGNVRSLGAVRIIPPVGGRGAVRFDDFVRAVREPLCVLDVKPAFNANRAFQRVPRDHGVVCSMSRKGDLRQRRNRKLQRDDQGRVDSSVRVGDTRGGASGRVRVHRETWYNARRLFSTLGYQSPTTFEEQPDHCGLTHFSTKSG